MNHQIRIFGTRDSAALAKNNQGLRNWAMVGGAPRPQPSPNYRIFRDQCVSPDHFRVDPIQSPEWENKFFYSESWMGKQIFLRKNTDFPCKRGVDLFAKRMFEKSTVVVTSTG